MTRSQLCGFAILGVTLACAGSALAAPGAALVEVATTGSWTAREQVQLHMAVTKALAAAGLQLVGPEQVEIALAGRSAASCKDDRCRIELGQSLGVGRLVFAHLRAESGGVTVTMVMFNVDVGERTGSATRFARGEAPGPLHAAMVQAAYSMLKAELPMAPARLSVRTRPPGARITIDGRPLGEGDAELPVTAGKHVVTLDKPGFTRATLRVDVKGGDMASIDVTLTRPGAKGAAGASQPGGDMFIGPPTSGPGPDVGAARP